MRWLGAACAVSVAACFAKPSASGGDAASPGPVARLVSVAYNYSGGHFPAAMGQFGFAIDVLDVTDGELLLFIGNLDNGDPTVWPDPIAPGFTQLAQVYYGNDHQTYVAAWKIADHEPTSYSGAYGSGGVISGDAVITLIAVSGVSKPDPIGAGHVDAPQVGANTSPALATNPGVTTTAANSLIVYASGADFQAQDGTVNFVEPLGFNRLVALGDKGTDNFEWTVQEVATATQAKAGPTGELDGSVASTTSPGVGWSIAIAVAPGS